MSPLTQYRAWLKRNTELVCALSTGLSYLDYSPTRHPGAAESKYIVFSALAGLVAGYHEHVLNEEGEEGEDGEGLLSHLATYPGSIGQLAPIISMALPTHNPSNGSSTGEGGGTRLMLELLEQIIKIIEVRAIYLEHRGKMSRYGPLFFFELIKACLRMRLWQHHPGHILLLRPQQDYKAWIDSERVAAEYAAARDRFTARNMPAPPPPPVCPPSPPHAHPWCTFLPPTPRCSDIGVPPPLNPNSSLVHPPHTATQQQASTPDLSCQSKPPSPSQKTATDATGSSDSPASKAESASVGAQDPGMHLASGSSSIAGPPSPRTSTAGAFNQLIPGPGIVAELSTLGQLSNGLQVIAATLVTGGSGLVLLDRLKRSNGCSSCRGSKTSARDVRSVTEAVLWLARRLDNAPTGSGCPPMCPCTCHHGGAHGGAAVAAAAALPPVRPRMSRAARRQWIETAASLSAKEMRMGINLVWLSQFMYIWRPVVYVSLLYRYGRLAWKPWVISLFLEILGIHFHTRGRRYIDHAAHPQGPALPTAFLPLPSTCQLDPEDVEALRMLGPMIYRKYHGLPLTEGELFQVGQRKSALLLYLLRSPFLDTFTRPLAYAVQARTMNVPVVNFGVAYMVNYMDTLCEYFFYTCSSST